MTTRQRAGSLFLQHDSKHRSGIVCSEFVLNAYLVERRVVRLCRRPRSLKRHGVREHPEGGGVVRVAGRAERVMRQARLPSPPAEEDDQAFPSGFDGSQQAACGHSVRIRFRTADTGGGISYLPEHAAVRRRRPPPRRSEVMPQGPRCEARLGIVGAAEPSHLRPARRSVTSLGTVSKT